MKATNNITNNILKSLILIAAIFFFQMRSAKAEGYSSAPSAAVALKNLITILAPTAPSSTDFSDSELNAADFKNLAPAVPAEAGFDETEDTISLNGLAPVVPASADFSDSDPATSSITDLAPTTPTTADFND